MKVLLIGSGGREHALARAISKSPQLTKLIIAPGNPGTTDLGENTALNINDNNAILNLAKKHQIDLVIIGPEAPLVAGAADLLRASNIAVFGPNRDAARLEGSKTFAKTIMSAARIPTAQSMPCCKLEEVHQALRSFGAPYVVKQDGLAAGKGVVVTSDYDIALKHAQECLKQLGNPNQPAVLIEEFLDGPEASVFCLSDGKNVVALPAAQDFKRALDGNEGPNTGGMGAYSPLPWAPANLAVDTAQNIALPVIKQMANQGTPFVGLLYVGLALTSHGAKVVEFNVRFGDPETQSVLERLNEDLLTLLYSAATGTLGDSRHNHEVLTSTQSVVNVVLTAPGYPDEPVKGGIITGVAQAESLPGVHVIHAGTSLDENGNLRAAGGRVLSVVGTGDNLAAARERAYTGMSKIRLDGGHFRKDIASF